jgi:hypothetical protein
VRQTSSRPSERRQDGSELTLSEEKAIPTPYQTPLAPSTKDDNWRNPYGQPSVLPISGFAMYYNPNVMQEVVRNRLAMGHISPCPECIGDVALLRVGDLNRRVWLKWADGVVEGPFLVADVAAQHHIPQLLARNWVVDVDNQTAVRRGMRGPVMVTVLASPSAAQVQMSLETPAPTQTPLPIWSATPMATGEVLLGGFPTETPVPTTTPLPTLTAAPVASIAVTLGGFPTETPVPTITPLPALSPMLSVTATIMTTPMPTSTPLPTVNPSLTFTVVTTYGGFPTETPVPTITPLPPLTPVPASQN